MSEASPVGTSVMTLVARDDDADVNALVHYVITSSGASSSARDSEYFHVEPDTGVVRTKQDFDHEQTSLMTFVVMVTVNITDINDNPPRFDRPAYDVFVTDLASRGQFVTMVSASDADSGVGKMRYSLVDGNQRQSFDINPHNGIISLSSLRQPDLLATYILNVSVTDGVFTNFARVKITVRNANSHVPNFEHVTYSVEVSENLPRHTSVMTLSARDADQGIYGDVTYYIDSEDIKDVFDIEPETGQCVINDVIGVTDQLCTVRFCC